ncbi:hypothetical protein ROLI_029120 [Roseobacter fucihabitans]|uniref:Uncharacterized protein n=2 Tax=Roseobacter fucihabitans TaxID=1537242 RepID=A0ABZ2BV65_9RHOB|nr:hypothetical protein [Roseobacter litoralis]
MTKDESNYVEALKEVSSQSKSSIGVCALPLGILLAQLRFLAQVESVWLSLWTSIAAIALFCGVLIAWYMSVFIQCTLAMEIYRKNGNTTVKGQHYLAFLKRLTKQDELPFTEQGMVAISEPLVLPFWTFTIVGYVSLLVLLLSIVWGVFA